MFRAPGQLPSLETVIDDLPTRCVRAIARHLGLAAKTIDRYRQAEQAPRAVHLALFWETRWGQSTLDAEVFNRDSVQRGQIGALLSENAQLKATVQRLVDLLDSGDYGAANSPLFDPGAPAMGAGCERAATPRPIARRASHVGLVAVAAGAARVCGDPGAQLGQLRQDERGDDGAADEHQALA
jgi:hypothetical protein